jgi:hypothetical protein
MENILNWLVLSSDNPKQVALTIRGVLMLQVPLVFSFLNELGWLSSDIIIVKYITTVTAILGLILLIVGVVRKVINTIWPKKVAKKKK